MKINKRKCRLEWSWGASRGSSHALQLPNCGHNRKRGTLEGMLPYHSSRRKEGFPLPQMTVQPVRDSWLSHWKAIIIQTPGLLRWTLSLQQPLPTPPSLYKRGCLSFVLWSCLSFCHSSLVQGCSSQLFRNKPTFAGKITSSFMFKVNTTLGKFGVWMGKQDI